MYTKLCKIWTNIFFKIIKKTFLNIPKMAIHIANILIYFFNENFI